MYKCTYFRSIYNYLSSHDFFLGQKKYLDLPKFQVLEKDVKRNVDSNVACSATQIVSAEKHIKQETEHFIEKLRTEISQSVEKGSMQFDEPSFLTNGEPHNKTWKIFESILAEHIEGRLKDLRSDVVRSALSSIENESSKLAEPHSMMVINLKLEPKDGGSKGKFDLIIERMLMENAPLSFCVDIDGLFKSSKEETLYTVRISQ